MQFCNTDCENCHILDDTGEKVYMGGKNEINYNIKERKTHVRR